MNDMKSRLGHSLLKSIVDLRQQKGQISLEDLGSVFEQIASGFNTPDSPSDQFMHQEIAKLAQYIGDAKKEVLSISSNEKSEEAIVDASAHLDEVIKATEDATNTIMDAADVIQGAAAGIDAAKEKEITDATMRIYEACDFQDLTGQRISKVIKLLENIEERITNLNELFGHDGHGGEVVNVADNSQLSEAEADEKLMNGPQLSADSSSQEEIDALFASLGGKN